MKAKHIFALYGPANVGKTTVLKKLFALLTNAYPTASVEAHNPSEYDITVIVEIDGVLVGIGSEGDPNGSLDRSIKLFKAVGCTIIVCATRTRGKTVDIVKSLQPEYTLVWYQKESELVARRDQQDTAIAQILFDQIQKVLST